MTPVSWERTLNDNVFCTLVTSYNAEGNNIQDFTLKMQKPEANSKAIDEVQNYKLNRAKS